MGGDKYNRKMDSELFEIWFEKCLPPYPEKGTAIVMDNVSFHRKNNFLKYGFNLIFLPPYSPELNHIEKYWYVLKHLHHKKLLFAPQTQNRLSVALSLWLFSL